MRPRDVVQYTFEGGEADPQFERRADADLWGLTARRMRNVRLLNGGGFERRPGSRRVLSLSGTARLVPFISRAGTKKLLVLRNDQFDVVNTAETVDATVTGAGWLTANLPTLQFSQIDDRIIVASRAFFPKQITWSEAGAAFTVNDFAFDTRTDTSRGWPYYRFRDTRGVTIAPSARTGSITLQASADIFVAGHVGIRFEIVGREVQVTAFTDANTVTATVIQELYPTRRLTVGSTSGFSAGQIVQDSVSDTEMEVTSIVSATQLDVVLIDTFTDPSVASNTLIGPAGSTPLTVVGAAGAEGATVQWKEQFISTVRGYPGGVLVHKDRCIFYDFAAAPEIHAMSVIGFPEDFDVGDGLDDEAIIEGPGDALGKRVRHCVSSEQLLSLTEAGAYYVGEGPNTPLTPSNVEFLRIGPEPAGDCNPIVASEGAIFAESRADRLMLLAPTGQVRRVWGATELIAVASDLFNTPSRLLLADGCDFGPERHIFAINTDGSLCVINYRRDSELTGATLWSMERAIFVDLAIFENHIYFVANFSGTFRLLRFDRDRLLDDSTLFSNVSPATPTNAAFVSRTDVALVWRQTASGEDRRADLGNLYVGTAGGVLTGAPTASRDYEGGDRFDLIMQPWSPIDPMRGPIDHKRIARASLDVLTSGSFYLQGQLFTPYRTVDDPSAPPPLRTGWRRRRYLGRKRDWEFELTQIEAAPLKVRALVLEVR